MLRSLPAVLVPSAQLLKQGAFAKAPLQDWVPYAELKLLRLEDGEPLVVAAVLRLVVHRGWQGRARLAGPDSCKCSPGHEHSPLCPHVGPPLPGIDATRKEDYLEDSVFASVFGMARDAFKALPAWRQQAAKKKAGLF